MINGFYNLSDNDVSSLNELIATTTLGQNYRLNFLWKGQRTGYVLDFLARCGFREQEDIKTFVDHFALSLYRSETRYQSDIDFRILCESYHNKDSSFLPLVLKKVENRSGYSTLWGKVAPRPTWKKTAFYAKRLDSWLFSESKLNIPLPKFRETVARLMRRTAPLTLPRLKNFEQFISLRTLWGTSGSTDVIVDKNVPRSKWQNALLMTDQQLLELVNKNIDKAPVYTIIEKSEPNTVRAVVLVDLVTYLIETYGSYYLDQLLKNHPVFYNWKDETNRFRYWSTVVKNLKEGAWYADYDWSGWDENIKDDLYQIVMDITMDILKLYAPDFVRFEPYLRKAVSGAFLKGYSRRTTTSGLASGRRWTTYINSVVDAAFIVMACDTLGYNVLEFPDALVTLGDDSQTLLDPPTLSESITDVLNDFGAKINKQKSKITDKDPEFLKFIATTDGVTGVELRAIRSILWSTEEEKNSIDNVEMRLDLWTKFLSRVKNTRNSLFSYDDVFSTFVSDLSNKTRLGYDKIIRICATPTSLSGWGLLPSEPPYLGYEFSGIKFRDTKPPKLAVPSIYGEFRNSIEALAKQTLVRPIRESSGSYRVVKIESRLINPNPLGDHEILPLRPQNFINPDRNNVVSYVTDQLWLSQATLEQVRSYRTEPISKELRASIHSLANAWSMELTFKEVSKSAVSNPPVQRSEVLEKGEVLAGFFWKYIYSTFFVPFKTRRMNVASFRTLLFSAQFSASHTGLRLGYGLGQIYQL